MSFLVNCRRITNGSSLITSRINNAQNRTKHSISRATQTVSKENPLRQFVAGKGKSAGRNSKGRITIFHRGGGAKRSQRTVDLKRNTSSVGIVERIEYDPNRTSRIAVVRWEGEAERKDVDPAHLYSYVEDTIPPFSGSSYETGIGQFSFSSIPGMIESRKAVSITPKTRHVVVGLSNGVSPYSSKAKDEETRSTNVRDVFLSALKASDAWANGTPYYFYKEFGVPRMAVAGSRPDFFVPIFKGAAREYQRMALPDVKNWRKDSPVWDHKMKRKAAISWQSVRQQDIGLDFVGVAGDKDSRMKAMEKAREKMILNRKFTADRAPVTYILATNQMKPGQVVMNIDSSKHSKNKLLKRY